MPVTVNLFAVKSLPEVIVTVDPFTNTDWASVPIWTVPVVADDGVIERISLNSMEPSTVPEPPFITSVWYIPSLSYPATVKVFPVSLLEKLNPIISNYVEQNSITVVLPKKMIIIGKKDLDITRQILEMLDKSIKKINFNE